MKNNNVQKDNLAILVLAGKVNLPNYNFKSHEYLFNIGNSLAFEKILKNLNLQYQIPIYIAVSKLNVKFAKLLPFQKAIFIEVGNTKNILDSISKAIKKIKEKRISIIPITTIPDLPIMSEKCCYFGSKQIPKENWSSISKLNKEKYQFHYKNDTNSYGIISHPCTGRLVADKFQLENSIKDIETNKKADILSLVKVLIQKYHYKIVFEKWLDIGHEATYIDSKLTSMTSRFFNNIFYLEENKTILKSSTDFKKIQSEYFFYKNLSNNLKTFFPHIYSEKKIKEKINEIEMEFIPYPNLSEIFLFNNIGPNSWIRIINSIKKIYKSFYLEAICNIQDDASWLYSSKLLKRFEMTINFIPFSTSDIFS